MQAEFVPGSRGRVLRNKLSIRRVRDTERAESEALVAVQEVLLQRYTSSIASARTTSAQSPRLLARAFGVLG